MPWLGLCATLLWNVVQHWRGKSTICSITRHHLPFWAVVTGWAGLTIWLLPHVKRGYPRAPIN